MVKQWETRHVVSAKAASGCLNTLIDRGIWIEGEPLKLHLGCGEKHLNGYINIDFPPSEHTVQVARAADVFADITEITFPDESIDEIRLHHVFEHFDRPTALALLLQWQRWLKIGGCIVIETPDLAASLTLMNSPDLSYQHKQIVLRHLFGSHEANWAVHKDGWYQEKFETVLSRLGFEMLTYRHDAWSVIRNITVTAYKIRPMNAQSSRKAVDELLLDSLVDQSECELRKLTVWKQTIDRFNPRLEFQISNQPPKQNTSILSHQLTRNAIHPSKPEVKILGLLFSKDRALQLDAVLRTFFFHCKDNDSTQLKVIYKTSKPHYEHQYQTLIKHYPEVEFLPEESFRVQTLAALKEKPFVLFLVDDNIFTHDFLLGEVTAQLITHTDALGFSLRLGEGISYCYPHNQAQRLPVFQQISKHTLKFDWTRAELYFHYPLEISSSIYRSDQILQLIKNLNFSNPNTLEALMAEQAEVFQYSHPYLLCFSQSATFCAPFNMVQSVYDNRSGLRQEYTPEALAQLFDAGDRLDPKAYSGFTPYSCHQEVDLLLTKLDRSPRISICIPTYNRSMFIAEAIRSALNQSYPAHEIVIVDDGSTDETEQIVATFRRTDILYFRKEHSGAPATRNRCIVEASGDFILWLDSDDILEPETLEIYVKQIASNPDIDVLYGDLLVCDSSGKVLPEYIHSYPDWYKKNNLLTAQLLQCNAIPNPGTLVRKSLYKKVGGYDESFLRAHDYEWWTRACTKAVFKHAGIRVCKWRWHSNNMSSGTVEIDTSYDARVVKRLLQENKYKELFPNLAWEKMPEHQAKASALYQVGVRLNNLKDIEGALAYLQASYDAAPSYEAEQLMAKLKQERNGASDPAARQSLSILLGVHNLPVYNLGGTEQYTIELAQELRQHGHHVELLFPSFDPSHPAGELVEMVYKDFIVHRLNLQPPDFVKTFQDDAVSTFLKDLTNPQRFDLVHFQHLAGLTPSAVQAFSDAGVPVILTLHDGWLICEQFHFIQPGGAFCDGGPESTEKCAQCFIQRSQNPQLQERLPEVNSVFIQRRKAMQALLSRLDALVSPSIYLQQSFIKHGFDHQYFLIAPLGLRPSKNIVHSSPTNPLHLVYLGNIFYPKGLDILIKAINQIDSDEARLEIWGRVVDSAYFENVISQIRDRDQVTYRGAYEPDDLADILSCADLAVIPSRAENFPFTVRECMQAGVPVIAPRLGGIPEIITDNKDGLLFTPGDEGDLAAKIRFFTEFPSRVEAFRQNINPPVTTAVDAQRLEALYWDILTAKKAHTPVQPDRKKQNSQRFSTERGYVISKAVDQDQSRVDIVIPIYGQVHLLKRCVESVLSTAPQAHLVLVDDCSPGQEVCRIFEGWQGHPNITLARTLTNQGFIAACKLGASLGHAPFLLFLNSDTEAIQPGWVEKMIPNEEDTAIVGAKLLYPPDLPGPLSGCLQHAGVARNAKGVPYHPFLGQPASTAEANQSKWVNAVTGACFLIRRSVWEELGGWDERFGKGVYEDVDLCWQARSQGYRVLYQPDVMLYHRESASKALDGHHSLNEHTSQNLKKLLEKWQPLKSDEDLFFGEKTVRRWQRGLRDLQRARAALDQRNLPAARSKLQKALQQAHDHPEVLASYAQFLISQGNTHEAVQYIQKAVQAAPAAWNLRLQLCDALLSSGQFEAVEGEISQLNELFPGSPEITKRAAQLRDLRSGSDHEPRTAISVEAPGGNHPAETLALILEADDLLAALHEHANRLDASLLELIQENALAALQDGNIELATGLSYLADTIKSISP